jgi:hypothetical protein
MDEVMVALGLGPFSPVSGMASRRRRLWEALCQTRLRGEIAPVPVRSAGIPDSKPSALPRAVRDGNSLLRTIFVAALSGVTLQEAALIARAHLEGCGEFSKDPEREARNTFQVLAAAGWGITTDNAGITRLHR